MGSFDKMRDPLRAITITFAPTDQDDVIGLLRSRAYRIGFASRVVKNPANSDEFFLQFYRQDIKLIGQIQAGSGELDLVLFRNGDLLEPAQFIDAAIETLRNAVSGIASAQFKQVVFITGDKVDRTSSTGIVPTLSAIISFPKEQVMPLTDALAAFANAQQMAVRFQQIAPGPENFLVQLYREDLMISGSRGPDPWPLSLSIYKTGDRSVSDATLAATFSALKQAVEAVPGVTFTLKP